MGHGGIHLPRIARGRCKGCELCRLLCPDLAITRDPETGEMRIDLAYCKGCGICEAFCPKKVIRMGMDESEAD